MQPSFFNLPYIFFLLTLRRVCVVNSLLVIGQFPFFANSPSDSNNLNLNSPKKLHLDELLQLDLLLCNEHQSWTAYIILSQVELNCPVVRNCSKLRWMRQMVKFISVYTVYYTCLFVHPNKLAFVGAFAPANIESS